MVTNKIIGDETGDVEKKDKSRPETSIRSHD